MVFIANINVSEFDQQNFLMRLTKAKDAAAAEMVEEPNERQSHVLRNINLADQKMFISVWIVNCSTFQTFREKFDAELVKEGGIAGVTSATWAKCSATFDHYYETERVHVIGEQGLVLRKDKVSGRTFSLRSFRKKLSLQKNFSKQLNCSKRFPNSITLIYFLIAVLFESFCEKTVTGLKNFECIELFERFCSDY